MKPASGSILAEPAALANGDVKEEHVRERAYELFEQRGRQSGHELEDWLQAEAELGTIMK